MSMTDWTQELSESLDSDRTMSCQLAPAWASPGPFYQPLLKSRVYPFEPESKFRFTGKFLQVSQLVTVLGTHRAARGSDWASPSRNMKAAAWPGPQAVV